MQFRVFSLAAAACLLIALAGCGSSSPRPTPTSTMTGSPNPAPNPTSPSPMPPSSPAPTPSPTPGSPTPSPSPAHSAFLYCAQNSGNTIFSARIDANTGSVTPVNSASTGTPGSTATIRVVAHPSGQYVYASDTQFFSAGQSLGTPGIGEFRVDRSTGAISPLAGSPILTSQRGDLVLHPDGRFAYDSHFNDGSDVFSIDANTGTLAMMSTAQGSNPGGERAAISPSGNLLFRPLNNQMAVDSVDATSGGLTAVAGSPFTYTSEAASPNDVLIDPTGTLVYVSGSVGGPGITPAGRIWTLRAAANGSVTLASTTNLAADINDFRLAVTPDSRFLYVAGLLSSGAGMVVHEFSVNASTGALTELGGSPITTGMMTGDLTGDLSGTFVFATGDSGTITYRIGSGGALAKASASADPKCVFPTTGP